MARSSRLTLAIEEIEQLFGSQDGDGLNPFQLEEIPVAGNQAVGVRNDRSGG